VVWIEEPVRENRHVIIHCSANEVGILLWLCQSVLTHDMNVQHCCKIYASIYALLGQHMTSLFFWNSCCHVGASSLLKNNHRLHLISADVSDNGTIIKSHYILAGGLF
jgi:hypothetical protein